MSISTFEKSLLQVIKGVHVIEEFSERVIRAAVSETIRRISVTYGLNANLLHETMLEDIVNNHARTILEEPKCKAITYRGKRCTSDAISDGYCQLHARQQIKPNKRKTEPTKCTGDDVASKCAKIFTSVEQETAVNRPLSVACRSVDHTLSPNEP